MKPFIMKVESTFIDVFFRRHAAVMMIEIRSGELW